MKKITLTNPVVLKDGRQFAVIEIGEPTLGALAAHEVAYAETGSSLTALMALLRVETGWPGEAIAKIPASSVEALSEAVRPFLSGDQPGPTGEASPPMSPTS